MLEFLNYPKDGQKGKKELTFGGLMENSRLPHALFIQGHMQVFTV